MQNSLHSLFIMYSGLKWGIVRVRIGVLWVKVGYSGPEYVWKSTVVSARLVEAENSDWRIFRVLEERLINWFGKSCPIFELGLHLNWAMTTFLPALIVYLHYRFNSPILRKLHFLPFKYCKSHNYALSDRHLQCLWTQVHILGIYNTTKVGNVSFVISGS